VTKEIEHKLPKERKHLSREEFKQHHGASDADLEEIKKFAKNNHLEVVEISKSKRTVKLAGTIKSFSNAFDVKLALFDHPTGQYRGREGPLYIPQEISGICLAVVGLDDRKQLFPRYKRFQGNMQQVSAEAEKHPFDPPQVASLYNFPNDLDGSGQCIGILEFGGGYDNQNLSNYFKKLGINNPPSVTSVSIDGATNTPNVDPDSDGEVQLDIEVIGAIAHGAKIVVYFAPNTDQGFIDAITTAIHDTTNNPSVISISWGSHEEPTPLGDESGWSDQTRNSMNMAFQDAASLGVTICTAAGDHGSSDYFVQSDECINNPTMKCALPPDGKEHVDFPASSPYVLACGGTFLTTSGNTISNEGVWNDNDGWATGGGISTEFNLPDYQANANIPISPVTQTPGRGVPDVSGNADSETGYNVSVDGEDAVIGGTSAVAPLWSALVAILNQGLGTNIGFINPLLYKNANTFHDITSGNNDTVGRGNYNARAGWDACTGLGSPDGQKILSALASLHQKAMIH
jgi:kumamolisin